MTDRNWDHVSDNCPRSGGNYYYILCYATVNDGKLDQASGYGHSLKPVFLIASFPSAVAICLSHQPITSPPKFWNGRTTPSSLFSVPDNRRHIED
ncbi:MAG: hypothetical protein WAK17_12315 [Candidatus Nitrosopolaris sp.]